MILSNEFMSLEFDDETGSLCQVEDLTIGRCWLDDPRGFRLAKLIVPTSEHMSRPLYSHEAGKPLMAKHGDILEIVFPELCYRGEKTGVFLAVYTRLPQDSSEAFLSVEIRNESSHRVHELWFPWIGGRLLTAGQSKDLVKDTITTSRRPSRDIAQMLAESGASTHSFGHHHLRIAEDPIHLLPMMDLTSGDSGISYIKYEKRPSPHILVFENALFTRQEISLTWSWATGVFIEPGETWKSCEFGIGVHQGDWHDTADRLRNWVQGWWKPCETPAEVKEKIGLFHVTTHGFSGEPYHEFSELPLIARDIQQYGIHDLMIWDNTASIYYRPDQGDFWEMPAEREQELRQALSDVHQLGCSLTSFVNWRLFSEYNRTWSELQPLVQESLFGIGLFGFPCGTMDGGWYNDPGYEMGSHAACCGADGYRSYANKILERTFDLGFDVISIDQASEWNYCLSQKHGHASPWEAWQRTYEWYDEVTRLTRQRYPGSYTLAELPDLYNTQHIDLWWNWGWREAMWGNANVFRYVLPNMIPVWCIDENQRDVLAEAFATGSFLAIATRDMSGLLSDQPDLAAQIKRLAALRKVTAEFVSHGRFLDNRGLTVEGGKGYLFESERGLAITLANGSEKRRTLKVILSIHREGLFSILRKESDPGCILYVEGAKPRSIVPQNHTVANGKDNWLFKAVLPAYGAGVITIEPS